jgi:hypothetical protein
MTLASLKYPISGMMLALALLLPAAEANAQQYRKDYCLDGSSTGTTFTFQLRDRGNGNPITQEFVLSAPPSGNTSGLRNAIINQFNSLALAGGFTIQAAIYPTDLICPGIDTGMRVTSNFDYNLFLDGCCVCAGPCAFNPVVTLVGEGVGEAPIPTVSEWGLMTMSLLFLAAGTLLYGHRQSAMTLAGVGTVSPVHSRMTTFKPLLFAKCSCAALAIYVLACALAYRVDGELATRDAVGGLIVAVLSAYVVHLWLDMRKAR